jgi:hypothetical protein
MKNNKKKNPYATLSEGRVVAPNKPKDEPKAKKQISNKDLRAGRGN